MSEYLSVDNAAQLVGVSAKTIRRAIKDGKLAVEKGGKHHGYQILRSDVEALYGSNKGVSVASPLASLTAEISELKAMIEKLNSTNEEQTRKIENLEHEVHDSRAQIHQLNEQIVRALPAPRRGWWPFRKRDN